MPQPAGAGPNKTVMLAPIGRHRVGAARQQPQCGKAPGGKAGASTTFWIISLLMGIAIGALAYVIVLQVS